MIIALIGDSDISRWPLELYPSLITCKNTANVQKDDTAAATAPAPSSGCSIIVSGHCGATLHEVIPHVQDTFGKILLSKKTCENKSNTSIFLVICAGENDIGNGISLTDSTQSLDELLSSILNHPLVLLAHDGDNDTNSNNSGNTSHDNDNRNVQVGVIFLGPKLEPWLKYDASARKEYIRMSRSFEACFQRHCDDIARQRKSTTTTVTATTAKRKCSFSLAYVDCLTMFCGDNAHQIPGALFGGKAQAQGICFDQDEIHLSNEGYKIWKQVVENRIRDMISFKHA